MQETIQKEGGGKKKKKKKKKRNFLKNVMLIHKDHRILSKFMLQVFKSQK